MILEGRVAIVTGAGSGIARAGAMALAREGAEVVVADLSVEAAEETASLILANGGKVSAQRVDVGADGDLERLIGGTIEAFGRLDVLHSHVGIQVEGPLEEVAPEGMDRSWQLNVRAHFMAARLAMPQMRKQGSGSIIVTSSNSGIFHDREMIAYTTTKHAVIAMVKQVAVDYGPHNVRVNALCPGWVDTPFNEPYIRQMGGRDAIEAYVRERIPLGRWGTPEEVAEAILFLASDRSSFMTGHALVLDGGECIA